MYEIADHGDCSEKRPVSPPSVPWRTLLIFPLLCTVLDMIWYGVFYQELHYGGWVAPKIYFMGFAGVIRVGGVRIAGLTGIYNGR